MQTLNDGLDAVDSLATLAETIDGTSGNSSSLNSLLNELTSAASSIYDAGASALQGSTQSASSEPNYSSLAQTLLPTLQNVVSTLAPELPDTTQARSTMDQLASFLSELQQGVTSQSSNANTVNAVAA
jgi:hypothetical protein